MWMPTTEALFDSAPYEATGVDNDACEIGPSRLGAASEYLLAARLLARNHRVAVSLVDDDGVDLIVDYRVLVQVKSSAYRPDGKTLEFWLSTANRGRRGIARHVDVVALHGRDVDAWWLVPAALLIGRRRVHVCERDRTLWSGWRDAWQIFEPDPAG